MHAYQLGCKMKANKKSTDPAGKFKKFPDKNLLKFMVKFHPQIDLAESG